jgi:hypothetical protein
MSADETRHPIIIKVMKYIYFSIVKMSYPCTSRYRLHFCFLYVMSLVQISARTPAILDEIFVGFLSPTSQLL